MTPPDETAARLITRCISCGESGDGGFEVEDGPGPFCGQCWELLEVAFAPPPEALTPQNALLIEAGLEVEELLEEAGFPEGQRWSKSVRALLAERDTLRAEALTPEELDALASWCDFVADETLSLDERWMAEALAAKLRRLRPVVDTEGK